MMDWASPDTVRLQRRAPTQLQIFYQQQRNIGRGNEAFMELVRSGLTREDLARNLKRNPALWSRFAGFLEVLPSGTNERLAS
jgi:hypothetical protein